MNKITITEEQLKEYHDNGYLILRNVLDVKIIDKLLDFVFHVISLEAKSLIKDKQYSKNAVFKSQARTNQTPDLLSCLAAFINDLLPPQKPYHQKPHLFFG